MKNITNNTLSYIWRHTDIILWRRELVSQTPTLARQILNKYYWRHVSQFITSAILTTQLSSEFYFLWSEKYLINNISPDLSPNMETIAIYIILPISNCPIALLPIAPINPIKRYPCTSLLFLSQKAGRSLILQNNCR